MIAGRQGDTPQGCTCAWPIHIARAMRAMIVTPREPARLRSVSRHETHDRKKNLREPL
jgi:hypothetical protein